MNSQTIATHAASDNAAAGFRPRRKRAQAHAKRPNSMGGIGGTGVSQDRAYTV